MQFGPRRLGMPLTGSLHATIRRWRVPLAIGGTLLCGGLAVWGASAWLAVARHRAALDAVIELSAISQGGSLHTVSDAVRIFVNDHSQHNIDAEFRADWPYPYIMAEKVAAHAKAERAELAHMECSTRAGLVQAVLRRLGHSTRRIDVYDAHNLESHSFLDVWNADAQRWETQDPAYDLTWRDKRTGARISVAEAAIDLEAIEPCGRSACGWHVASREGFKASTLRNYFDFIVVRSPQAGLRYTVFTARATPDKVYQYRDKIGRFCEVMKKNCRDGLYDIATVPRAFASGP